MDLEAMVKELERQLRDAHNLIRSLAIVGGPKAMAILEEERTRNPLPPLNPPKNPVS